MVVMTEKGQESAADIQSSLQEEYLKSLEELEEGQLIDGTVVQMTSEHVFVDVGYKSEGKIPAEEFETPPNLGDTVSVVLIRKEGKGGQVVVSKSKADVRNFWKELRNAHQEGLPVKGRFDKHIKGGFEVDMGHNVRGFCPFSKADVVRVENPEDYLNTEGQFLIDRLYSSNKLKIVLSRRGFLEQDIEKRKKEFFESVQIGDTVEGCVKSFTSFGAFVDLGGFDGLLHINDMSWGHVTRPKDYVKKGQEISLKVIHLDPEEQKINLSLKHFTPDPWLDFENKYHVGDIVKGKVTKLTDFGAFVELEEGVEGLVHVSELSWVKRVNHPKEVVNVGDEVDVMILSYDIMQGRVSLGIKQVLPNPWDDIGERYPEGTRLKRKVVKITNAGAFVQLEEGIDAFLHADDLSWTKKIKNPGSVLKVDEEIECVVTELDPENSRIRVGVKQLSEDPWESLQKNYPKGSTIEGEVTSVTDFGVFVRVPGGIEGLIHKFNLRSPGDETPEEELLQKFKAGDQVTASVLDVKPSAQKLSLSIREYVKGVQKKEMSKYIHDDQDESTVTFADLLKEKGAEPFDS
ncbi:MAG TPA: 30S ribosomal protein S1 [Sediminispirochaeta sp.]|nr:30S ribosomal protein S1 [Sediminispirochaeta sp.]